MRMEGVQRKNASMGDVSLQECDPGDESQVIFFEYCIIFVAMAGVQIPIREIKFHNAYRYIMVTLGCT